MLKENRYSFPSTNSPHGGRIALDERVGLNDFAENPWSDGPDSIITSCNTFAMVQALIALNSALKVTNAGEVVLSLMHSVQLI